MRGKVIKKQDRTGRNAFGAREIGNLIRACRKGDIAFAKEMLQQGVDPNVLYENSGSHPLTAAVRGGSIALVRLLLDGGADPTLRDTWKSMPPNGTPLESACEGGNLDMVKLLIERNADINKKGNSTPLRAAVVNGHAEIVRFLLKLGARFEPDILMCAAWSGNAELGRQLIEAGADVNYRNSDGETPLHKAARVRTTPSEFAEILIAAGAQVNVVTSYEKQTPLHLAAKEGKLRMVQALLGAGADATLKGLKNKTAEEWARVFGQKEVAKLLRESGKQQTQKPKRATGQSQRRNP